MSAVSNVGSFILTICYLALATQTVQPMPYDPFTNIKYFSGNIKQQITGSSSNNANGGGGGNKDNYNDSYLSSYCDYDVDIFSCLNLNCNGIRLIRKFPKALKDITTYQLKPNQFLCSVDLSDTGIVELSATNTFEHFSFFYSNLLKFNPNQTTIKLSFSNIEYIRELKFPVELNLVLFVRDSNVRHVQPKSLSGSNKLELNFINVNMTIPNWFNLLESSRLKLLNLRNIQNLKEEYTAGVNKDVMFNPTTNIIDVKIHYSYLPVLDDHFIFFKLLKSIEQLEIIRCSIAFIKNTIFDKYSNTFRYLKYLALSNNNINRITDQTFNGLNNLITLDLDENPIEFIHPQTFTSLKKLRFLSMSSNTYSLNVKSLTKTTNPVWLFNMFKNNRELKEIHYKTSRLLNNYCILNSIVMNVKSFNENINGLKNNTLSLNHLINDALSSNGEFIFNPYADNYKKLRMFSPDQLEMRYETFIERSNLEILCSAYMVCKYTKVYDNNDNTDLWVIESFRVCPAIINKNMDSRCGLVQKNTECQNLLAGLNFLSLVFFHKLILANDLKFNL